MTWTTTHDTSRGIENRVMTHDFGKGVLVITDFGLKTIRVFHNSKWIYDLNLDDYNTPDKYKDCLIHINEKTAEIQ